MTENTTTGAPAATQPEAIGLALDVLREMLSDPDQRLDQCPARMTRANQAARALAGVQAAPAAQEAEPAVPVAADHATRVLAAALIRLDEAYRHDADEIADRPQWMEDALEVARSVPRPQADAGAVPEGWRLVPVEPTEHMSMAGGKYAECGLPANAVFGYRAMLAAAPQAPAATLPAPEVESPRDQLSADRAKNYSNEELANVLRRDPCSRATMWDLWEAAQRLELLANPAPAAAVARAAAPTQEADGWMPIETAPDGERVLLGPRHAPVVGTVHRPAFWEEEQEPTATVVHYNGNVLVAGYRCSEWHRLPGAAPTQEAEDAARYRWLRDVSVPPHNFYLSVPDEFKDERYTPAQVDAAIDAARARQEGGA